MAHFAQLNENNIVIRVIVVSNDITMKYEQEDEQAGIAFCQSLTGEKTVWKQTSYNASFRKNFAQIGYSWDETLQAFIPPQPYTSWVLDESTCRWVAPIAYPISEQQHVWDEEKLQWIIINRWGDKHP